MTMKTNYIILNSFKKSDKCFSSIPFLTKIKTKTILDVKYQGTKGNLPLILDVKYQGTKGILPLILDVKYQVNKGNLNLIWDGFYQQTKPRFLNTFISLVSEKNTCHLNNG